MRDGRLVTPYQKTFFFLNAIKYVTTALLVLSFQGGAAATQLKIVIAAASFVYDNFFLAIVASILMGSQMSSLQRRIAVVTDTTANLIAQLSELDRLREQVRKALLSA